MLRASRETLLTAVVSLVCGWSSQAAVITQSTYFGGTSNDLVSRIVLAPNGDLIVGGLTESPDLPTITPFQANLGGEADVFIARFDARGVNLLYSTYLGGSGWDALNEMAIDAAGHIYVAGETRSQDFPLAAAWQPTLGGFSDGFVAKLDTTANTLVFSTYLGGSGMYDGVIDLALDTAGNVWVAGGTHSPDFPTVNPYQGTFGGDVDAYFARFEPNGNLAFSSFLGGSSGEVAFGIVFGPSGSLHIAGTTRSQDFPLVNPYQGSCNCSGAWGDGFLTSFDSSVSTMTFSTFLGGTYGEEAGPPAFDAAGNVYLTGFTASPDFPVVRPFQATIGGSGETFISQFDSNRQLVFSSFFGGQDYDTGSGVLDPSGVLYIFGSTWSPDFPLLDSIKPVLEGPRDAYIAIVDAKGSRLVFSSLIGGGDEELAGRLVLDGRGGAYLVGKTLSPDFPTVRPYQSNLLGQSDGFISRIAVDCGVLTLTPATIPGGPVGALYSEALGVSGGVPPYTFSATGLPPGLALSPTGQLTGTLTTAGSFGVDVHVRDQIGQCGRQLYKVEVAGAPAPQMNVVSGQGHGSNNPSRVRVHQQDGTATPVDFTAYTGGGWGVNVSGAKLFTTGPEAILTGPGPGPPFGPHVRAFDRAGLPNAGVSFYAYGTLQFGVNVNGASIDGDLFDELMTGAGPGEVFGPHMRGFNYDAGSVTAVQKVNFFAYSTLKYGVNVGSGDVDADGVDELISGAGPGIVFAPQVRGWNFDGSVLTALTKLNYLPIPGTTFGAQVGVGDLDADGFDEIGATYGPGPSLRPRVVAHDYDATAIVAIPGFDVVVPYGTAFGGRISLGDITGDGRADLVASAGPDPRAGSDLKPYLYEGSLIPLWSFDPFGTAYGANTCVADLRY